MAENSNIEWTHHTFNPWWGCTKVSSGCQFCYADAFARGRFKLNVWGPTADRKPASEATWKLPAKWNRQAEAVGERHRVFCASMADVFEGPETCQNPEAYTVIRAARVRLFDTIARTPHLDWLLLTKRPENWGKVMLEVMQDDCADGASQASILCGRWYRCDEKHERPANIWIGTSGEDQESYEKRVQELLLIPAWVRFLSLEPLLGSIDLLFNRNGHHLQRTIGEDVHWVIAGGESGPNARPMHPDWARGLRDQCKASKVPFFFKQWGEWQYFVGVPKTAPSPYANDLPGKRITLEGKDHFCGMYKVGKKAAGRLLDGRTWDELPEVAL